MRLTEGPEQHALETYEAMASVYDIFTAHFETAGWLADLLEILKRAGLKGTRLLDVGCGTGESFIPMLERGWTVQGCDLSPEMLARAKEKTDSSVALACVDMRDLSKLGEFDLVWSLDDAFNYLLSVEELESTLLGMLNNLAEGGLILFDVNELPVYRTYYAEASELERDGLRFIWRGLGPSDVGPGSLCESRLEVFDLAEGKPTAKLVNESTHRQRHFPEAEIRAALSTVGLECAGVFGQGLDGIPRQPLDPTRHTKAIYLARRA